MNTNELDKRIDQFKEYISTDFVSTGDPEILISHRDDNTIYNAVIYLRVGGILNDDKIIHKQDQHGDFKYNKETLRWELHETN